MLDADVPGPNEVSFLSDQFYPPPVRSRFAQNYSTTIKSSTLYYNSTGEVPGKCVCNTCGKMFLTGGGLYKHKKIEHGRTEDLIPCPECDKKFVTQSALKRHMPRHSTDRPHVCANCGKSYKHKDALGVHSCR